MCLLISWYNGFPLKQTNPSSCFAALSSSGVLYIEMGAGQRVSSVCALSWLWHSTGNSHRLLMLPFASADGFLQHKGLGCSGEPCFFSTEKPGVQMRREISSHCRVFLFSSLLFSLWELPEPSLVETTKPSTQNLKVFEGLTH